VNPSRPPRGAMWLLQRFGPENEALTGDLFEEYRRGRSRRWFWKQVLSAVSRGFIADVLAHKLLAVRALVVGWATALILFQYVVGPLGRAYLRTLFYHGIRADALWRHFSFYPLLLIPYLCLFASGWAVALCHRRHELAMVLAYLLSLEIYFLPEAYRLVVDSFGDRRFLPYLAQLIFNGAISAVAVLLGGMLASFREAKRTEIVLG